MNLYRVFAGIFGLLTFLFAFIMLSNVNGGYIYWTPMKIGMAVGGVVSGVVISLFWKWAGDLLEAVRD
jgi:hypothetical protein